MIDASMMTETVMTCGRRAIIAPFAHRRLLTRHRPGGGGFRLASASFGSLVRVSTVTTRRFKPAFQGHFLNRI